MAYRFTFLFFMFSFVVAYAQPVNLVPNPGFEERSECQLNNGLIHHAPPWFRPSLGTPDVFHICGVSNPDPCPYPEIVFLDPWNFGVPTNTLGCQEPHSGDGYAGVFMLAPGINPTFEYREYLGVELVEPLSNGQWYTVSFYVSLAERTTHSIWAIQVAFLQDIVLQLDSWDYLPIEASLTHTQGDFVTSKTDWTLISFEYLAQGGENFMYIGNFQSNTQVESLSVHSPDDNLSGHYINNGYYYIDDVFVGTSSLSANDKVFNGGTKLWPNPASDIIYIEQFGNSNFQIIDILGRIVTEGAIYDYKPVELNISQLVDGVYLLHLYSTINNTSSQIKFLKR